MVSIAALTLNKRAISRGLWLPALANSSSAVKAGGLARAVPNPGQPCSVVPVVQGGCRPVFSASPRKQAALFGAANGNFDFGCAGFVQQPINAGH